MAELKPCPLCGGKARFDDKKFLIECKRCNATIYGCKIYKLCGNYKEWLYSLWNRRAEDGK